MNNNVDFNKIIGERIKEVRIERNMSQSKLAKFLNVSSSYISGIESGNKTINIKRLMQISEILDISPGYIITGYIDVKGCKSLQNKVK